MKKHQLMFSIALLCLLAVQCFATAPTIGIISPGSGGTAQSQTFTIQANDSSGVADIAWMAIWFGPTQFGVLGPNSCLMYIYQNGNGVYGVNDTGSSFTGGFPAGTNTVNSNSQCDYNVATVSRVNANNNTSMRVTFTVNFKAAFCGTKYISMEASSVSGQDVGQWQAGTWTIPGCTSGPVAPTVTMSSSPNPPSGSSTTVTWTSTHPDGAAGTNYIIGAVGNGGWLDGNSCTPVLWNYGSPQFGLLSDDHQSWIAPANSAAENSQCLATGFTKTISGNSVSLTVTLTAKASFGGTRQITGIAQSWTGNIMSPLYSFGNWTIPSGGGQVAESTYYANVIGGEVGPDNYSGDIKPLNTSDSPQQTVYLSSPANNPYVMLAGTPITISIKYAKPNQQVWGRVFQEDPISHAQDGSVKHVYLKPQVNGIPLVLYTTQVNREVLFGGWLLGTTDSQGSFSLPAGTYGFGGFVTHLYVGDMGTNGGATPGLNSQPGLPSDGFLMSLPDSNFVGAVYYWIQASNGQPVAPSIP